jgi:hypothetical protein
MSPPESTGAAEKGHPEITFFGDPAVDLMAGLIFELAAQLHEERAALVALEAALVRAGVLGSTSVAEAARLPSARADASARLDRSVASLLRILSERDDARAPLAGDWILDPRASERRP